MCHPPQIDLDRFVASELNARESDNISAHLENCVPCRVYVENTLTEKEELDRRKSPTSFAFDVEERMKASRRANASSHRRWAWGLSAATVAVAVSVIAILYLGPSSRDEQTPGLRWMGGNVATKIYLNRNEQTQLLLGQKPMPGDRLRYEVVVPAGYRMYAALIAVEGNRPSVLLPADPASEPFEVVGTTMLPGSVEIVPERGNVILLLIVRPRSFQFDELLQELGGTDDFSVEKHKILGLVHRLVVSTDSP